MAQKYTQTHDSDDHDNNNLTKRIIKVMVIIMHYLFHAIRNHLLQLACDVIL
jgi:hypothetical protein